MNTYNKLKLSALAFVLALGNFVCVTPAVAQVKNFMLFKEGKVVSRSSPIGIVTYHYKNGKLKEVRWPGHLAIFIYKDDKLERISHLNGRVDRAVYTDGKLTGFDSNRERRIVPARSINGNVVVPDEPLMQLAADEGGGQACQLSPDGQIDYCSDWGGGNPGGGEGEGGGYPYPPGGGISDGGGGSSGGTPPATGPGDGQSYFDPDPIEGKSFRQLKCEADVMKGYYAFAKECAKEPTAERARRCHEANSELMASGLRDCEIRWGN